MSSILLPLLSTCVLLSDVAVGETAAWATPMNARRASTVCPLTSDGPVGSGRPDSRRDQLLFQASRSRPSSVSLASGLRFIQHRHELHSKGGANRQELLKIGNHPAETGHAHGENVHHAHEDSGDAMSISPLDTAVPEAEPAMDVEKIVTRTQEPPKTTISPETGDEQEAAPADTASKTTTTAAPTMVPLKSVSAEEQAKIDEARIQAAKDCKLSTWSEWSACFSSEEFGGLKTWVRQRIREVVNPRILPEGKPCRNDNQERLPCKVE